MQVFPGEGDGPVLSSEVMEPESALGGEIHVVGVDGDIVVGE